MHLPRRARLPLIAVTATALAATVLAATATAASAHQVSRHHHAVERPIVPGSDYLALGDSVSFGYREPTTVPAPDYANASTFVGYPEILGRELGLRVENLACPGETSSSLLNAHAQSNGCENTPTSSGGSEPVGYRTLYPLHVRYSGSQISQGIYYLRTHPDTRLVTLMIGANDAFVCDTQNGGTCPTTELAEVIATISHNVASTLADIRYRAHYAGQLVLVNYYSLDYADAADNAESMLLNHAMDKPAKAYGAVIAHGYAVWKQATTYSGSDTCTAGLLTQTTGPGATSPCGIHPSYAGASLLAQAVQRAIVY